MITRKLQRGMEVTVLAFGGKKLRRRVWKDIGEAVFICTEEEYQRATQVHDEANASGFPREYVLEVHDPLPPE